MTQRTLWYRLVATFLVVAVQGLMIPSTAGDGAAVEGAVVSSVDQRPLEGARIHLGDPASGEVYSSAPAEADGSFALADVPPATYQVGVEHEGGLYVVESPVSIAPGQLQPLMVAVNPQSAPSPEAQEKNAKKKSGTGVWNNPATAALIVLGAAIVVGVIINEATKDDDTVPPVSTPTAP